LRRVCEGRIDAAEKAVAVTNHFAPSSGRPAGSGYWGNACHHVLIGLVGVSVSLSIQTVLVHHRCRQPHRMTLLYTNGELRFSCTFLDPMKTD
jgi:hypothetical protein